MSEESKRSAISTVEIASMLASRLEHTQWCSNPYCDELSAKEVFEGLNIAYSGSMEPDEQDLEDYHKEELAREHIMEMPLDIELSQDIKDTKTYIILMGTGGPAVRIVAIKYADKKMEVFVEHQDWFEKWQRLDLADVFQEKSAKEYDYLLSLFVEEIIGGM